MVGLVKLSTHKHAWGRILLGGYDIAWFTTPSKEKHITLSYVCKGYALIRDQEPTCIVETLPFYDCFRNVLTAQSKASTPKPTLISKRTGGSGTDWAETLFVVVTGVVAACIGAASEPLDRLEKASDVVGQDRSVRNTNREP
jgi:hypothetical protein